MLLEFLCALGLGTCLLLIMVKLLLCLQTVEQRQLAWLRLSQQAYYLSSYFLPYVTTLNSVHCDDQPTPSYWVRGYGAGRFPRSITQPEQIQGDVFVVTRCELHDTRYQYQSTAYYVARTNRRSLQAQSIYALYAKPLSGNRIELEEGIRSLRIEYGLIDSSGKTHYVSDDQVSHWDAVKKLHLHFVLSSIDASSKYIEEPWDIYTHVQIR